MKTLALTPRLTEKTYGMAGAKSQVYAFDVDKSANKHSVARAVASQFEVTVVNVRLLNNKGKAKRTIAQKGRKVYKGHEAGSKKAYVTLKPGDSLPFFQAIEEEERKQERTQEKMEKAMEKQEAKETKTKTKSTAKSASPASKTTETDTEPESDKKPLGFLRLGGRHKHGGDK